MLRIRIRYLTLKLRALCWLLRRLRARGGAVWLAGPKVSAGALGRAMRRPYVARKYKH